jgi:small GTP-binding protein
MAYSINVPNDATLAVRSLPGQDLGNGMRMIKDNTGKYAGECDLLVKSIVIGDSGCGKSSLMWRFTDNNYTPTFISTIGVDFKTVVFDRQGKVVKMQLWDCAGQDRFQTIVASFFRGIHAAMLVFSLDDAESFDNIRNWVKVAHKNGTEDMRFLLIGNKLDIVTSNPHLRQVSTEAAQNLAQTLGCDYIETSAKADVNVAAAFAKLTESAIERKLQSLPKDPTNPNGLRNPNKQPQRIQLGTGAGGNGDKKIQPLCRCG